MTAEYTLRVRQAIFSIATHLDDFSNLPSCLFSHTPEPAGPCCRKQKLRCWASYVNHPKQKLFADPAFPLAKANEKGEQGRGIEEEGKEEGFGEGTVKGKGVGARKGLQPWPLWPS